MMSGRQTVDRVQRAYQLLQKAGESWNAGSVTAVEQCLCTLEQCAAELSTIQAQARAGLYQGRGAEILQIKQGVMRLQMLAGLAGSFLHGGGSVAGESPLYQAGGAEETPSSRAATTRLHA